MFCFAQTTEDRKYLFYTKANECYKLVFTCSYVVSLFGMEGCGAHRAAAAVIRTCHAFQVLRPNGKESMVGRVLRPYEWYVGTCGG